MFKSIKNPQNDVQRIYNQKDPKNVLVKMLINDELKEPDIERVKKLIKYKINLKKNK